MCHDTSFRGPHKIIFVGVTVWTRCVDINKFTHNAIFRESESRSAFEKCGAAYHAEAPKKERKRRFFFCLQRAQAPTARLCGGTVCHDISSELDAL